MRKTLLFLLMLLSITPAFTQISYEKRIEFELGDDYTDEALLEFGKEGFIVRSQKKGSEDGQREWRYERYNTDLEAVDKKTVMVSKKYEPNKTYITKDRAHTLYRSYKSGGYLLHSIDAILDAYPAVETDAVQLAEDGVVVVQALADRAVP